MTQHSSFAAGAKFTEAQLETAIIELLGKEGLPARVERHLQAC